MARVIHLDLYGTGERGYREYRTLGVVIRTSLAQYGWNRQILDPLALLDVCKRENVGYIERPLDNGYGLYGLREGQRIIALNSQASRWNRWYGLACSLSFHFVRDHRLAFSLGHVALLPTWMLARFSMVELLQWGYHEEFLAYRYHVREEFPDVPTSAPPEAANFALRGRLIDMARPWV
jgi:hypothetical protein